MRIEIHYVAVSPHAEFPSSSSRFALEVPSKSSELGMGRFSRKKMRQKPPSLAVKFEHSQDNTRQASKHFRTPIFILKNKTGF